MGYSAVNLLLHRSSGVSAPDKDFAIGSSSNTASGSCRWNNNTTNLYLEPLVGLQGEDMNIVVIIVRLVVIEEATEDEETLL